MGHRSNLVASYADYISTEIMNSGEVITTLRKGSIVTASDLPVELISEEIDTELYTDGLMVQHTHITGYPAIQNPNRRNILTYSNKKPQTNQNCHRNQARLLNTHLATKPDEET